LGGSHPSFPVVHGSVEYVISGSAGQHAVAISPASFRFAIGCGSVRNRPDDLGELIVVGGQAFVKPSGEKFGGRIGVSPRDLLSPFAVGVPAGAVPESYLHFSAEGEGAAFSDFVVQVLGGRRLVFYVGFARFRQLETTAIKLAPIAGEPINTPENRPRYWADPVTVENQLAIICGMAVRNDAADPKVFYVNPADRAATSGFQVHTHVLSIEDQLCLPAALAESAELGMALDFPDPLDVGHLLNQSLLREAVLGIYEFRAPITGGE
jgi:hypothetical protein